MLQLIDFSCYKIRVEQALQLLGYQPPQTLRDLADHHAILIVEMSKVQLRRGVTYRFSIIEVNYPRNAILRR